MIKCSCFRNKYPKSCMYCMYCMYLLCIFTFSISALAGSSVGLTNTSAVKPASHYLYLDHSRSYDVVIITLYCTLLLSDVTKIFLFRSHLRFSTSMSFHYVLLMPTKFSCLAAAWDVAPWPHFHYLPNDLLHHQAGDRKGKVSNFRWLRDRKIGSGILSSSVEGGQRK